MATHSSFLGYRIPWREEPSGVAVHGVAKSQIPLKQLSMHAHGRGYRVKPEERILFTGPSQPPL